MVLMIEWVAFSAADLSNCELVTRQTSQLRPEHERVTFCTSS
jgi:hypothetical protein